MDFAIQIRKQTNPNGNAPIIAEFQTNNVLEFSEYIGEAVSYFSGMVRFDSSVYYVGMMVRCYKDHHVINISRDGNGELQVSTTQP